MKPINEHSIKESIDFILDSFRRRKGTDSEVRLSIRERQMLKNIATQSDKLDFQKDDMSTLEKLTPAGSEYHNDPKACYDYVKEEKKRRTDLIKKLVKENRELKNKLSIKSARETDKSILYGFQMAKDGMTKEELIESMGISNEELKEIEE